MLAGALLLLGCLQPQAGAPLASPTLAATLPPATATPTPAPAVQEATTTATAPLGGTPTPIPTVGASPAAGTLEGLAASVQGAAALGLDRTLRLEETTQAYGGYTQKVYAGAFRDSNYDLSVLVSRPATRWSSTDLTNVQPRTGESGSRKAEVYWEQSSTFDRQTNKIRMPCYGWRFFIDATFEIFLPSAGSDPLASNKLVAALVDACPD
jgi:hypothetical protein